MVLPHGVSEDDYEAIEAAVTETVRGRWFLHEFARRNRAAELREILDTMRRLEGVVGSVPTALPATDPSVRLLLQRVKEIAGQLDALASDMRTAGADETFSRAVAEQGRAVRGMMRGPAPTPPTAVAAPGVGQLTAPPVAPALAAAAKPGTPAAAGRADPRLRLLEHLDRLPLAEKLALFA